MDTKPSFMIVGGGLTGATAAQTLREEGFDGKTAGPDVTLPVSGEMPLQRVLGPEVAPIFAELHRSHGVDLRYRTKAAELTGKTRAVTGVILIRKRHMPINLA
jgi:3-phenylpropionate/trans-cinnamate dioxygenase ferredoxin reductase subunit